MTLKNRLLKRLIAIIYQFRLLFISKSLIDSSSPKFMVSLTSYEPRFEIVFWTIKSIMAQTLKPQKVVLYLDKHVMLSNLPKRLQRLQKYGLEIKNICDDIKPHKKYFYAMQEYLDFAIITIDDDMMYEPNTLKDLYESYRRYPTSVSAKRVCKMKKNSDGKITSYNSWDGEYTSLMTPSESLFATGVGGVLYPPQCFDKDCFDVDRIKSLCLCADDVWLKFMELRCNRKVVFVPGKMVHPYSCRVKNGLQDNNVGMSMNDIFIQNMMTYTNIDLADFVE